MSANRSTYLLAALLSVLAARGLAPEALDPWRGWAAFKQFVREAAEQPDHGVSVQIYPLADRHPIRLVLLRQVLVPEGDRLEPVGGVVCEFWFAPRRWTPAAWDAWTFDSRSFDRFVDLVEQHPTFTDLLTTRPLATAVRWEHA